MDHWRADAGLDTWTQHGLADSDSEFGRGKLYTFPALFEGFDVDFSRIFGGLHDDLGETIEERTVWFFVRLLTIGIAVADANERACA